MPTVYSILSQDERNIASPQDRHDSETWLKAEARPRLSFEWLSMHQMVSLFHWFVHILTTSLLVMLLIRNQKLSRSCFPATEATLLYAPAYEKLSRIPHFQVFQNAFWQKSPYKGPPTKEIVDRWNHLTQTDALNLTSVEISKLGISLDSVQYPASAGGGYIGFLESAHQLHCLQALWEHHHFAQHPELFPDLAEKLSKMPDIEEHHFEHCVDVIRQRLMCTADASIVTFSWVKGLSSPYPNFKTNHMCMDYEALLEWDRRRRADMSLVEDWDWRPANGDVVLSHLP